MSAGAERYGDLVTRAGLAHSHRLVFEAVPEGARVLDVGCATGYLAAALAQRGARVTGVEADPGAAARARERGVEVTEGDVEDPAVLAALPRELDVVVLADVLEHLRDPAAVLSATRALLAPEGVAVVSLPNVAHWTARRELLRGRYPRADHGIFDRSHLRFFTRATAHDLAAQAGFAVARERFATSSLPLEPSLRRRLGGTEQDPPAPLAAARARLTAWRPELFALQFVLTLRAR